jgi:hypothetical protein
MAVICVQMLMLADVLYIIVSVLCVVGVPEKRNEIYILNPKKAYNICEYSIYTQNQTLNQ